MQRFWVRLLRRVVKLSERTKSYDVSVTALVFGIVWLLYFIPSNINFLDPIAKTFSDFELTDVVFSRLRDDAQTTADTSIVLVNIGTLSRKRIAEQIQILSRFKPKVIGIDAMFRAPKDPQSDSILAAALAANPAIVMVSHLVGFQADSAVWSVRQTSHSMFQTQAGTGFDNVISEEPGDDRESTDASDEQDKTHTVRSFSPSEEFRAEKTSTEWAFAVKLAGWYDEPSVRRLFKRGSDVEIINYMGNTDKFFTLDAAEVLDTSGQHARLHFLEGKIVIMGFLGETLGRRSNEDMFFTPLNKRYTGRAYPDMFGAVVHANVTSMILHGRYIHVAPEWLTTLFAILLCYANVVAMTTLYEHYRRWYDIARIVMQFVQSLGLLVAFTLAFHFFSVKLDVSLAVAAVVVAAPLHEIYHSVIESFHSSPSTSEES